MNWKTHFGNAIAVSVSFDLLFVYFFISLFISYVYFSSYFCLGRQQKKYTSLRVLGFYNQVRLMK